MKFIVSWGRDDFLTPAGNENGTGTGRDTAAEKDGKAALEGTEGIGAHGGAAVPAGYWGVGYVRIRSFLRSRKSRMFRCMTPFWLISGLSRENTYLGEASVILS